MPGLVPRAGDARGKDMRCALYGQGTKKLELVGELSGLSTSRERAD